jgi:hypothetical protein
MSAKAGSVAVPDRTFLFRRIFVWRDFRHVTLRHHIGHRRHDFRLLPLGFVVHNRLARLLMHTTIV